MLLLTIFCQVDDFCKEFQQHVKKNVLTNGVKVRNRSFAMTASEIMTIIIWYHHSGYKTFKDYYTRHVMINLRSEFPNLVSYSRFVELKQQLAIPLIVFNHLMLQRSQRSTHSFIDSFKVEVCHPRRIHSHKTLKKGAQRGKTSIGWFFGYKLHITINLHGEITSFCISSGNTADNNKDVLLHLTKDLKGKLYGDKEYIVRHDVFKQLYDKGVHLITKLKKNMKNKLMFFEDKLALKKRGIIESVGSILKNELSLEHSRHRSPLGFFCHLISTLIAYAFREKKPSASSLFQLIPSFC